MKPVQIIPPLLQTTPRGLYCPAGDFYVDPWREVPVAVLTHAHSDHARSGSGKYFATRASENILRRRLGETAPLSVVEYGVKFQIGGVTVSLHPAGHILGSAQVRLEAFGEVWVISGDYKRAADPSCAPFEVVPCDTFVTEATFGLPVYRWNPGSQTAAEIWEWWEKNRALGQVSLLGCYSLGKAQRILAELTQFTDRTVFAHGAVQALTDCYRAEGIAMLPTLAVGEADKAKSFAGELVLAPPSALGSSWSRRFAKAQTGFASGWMRLRGNRRRKGFDRGFVLSDHADWPELLQTVRDTGARRIFVTHGNSGPLVRYLNENGREAHPLETLFEGDDAYGEAE